MAHDVVLEFSDELFWRIKYYAVLDTVIENINHRFSDESLDLANAVDKFFSLIMLEVNCLLIIFIIYYLPGL